MSNFGRNIALWAIVALLLVTLFRMFDADGGRTARGVTYTEFLEQVDERQVRDVVIKGRNIEGHFVGGQPFSTYAPDDAGLIDLLRERGVAISAKPAKDGVSPIFTILLNWLPMILIIAVWIFFMRQMQGSSGRAMGFGKSRARLLTEKQGRVTFEDVAGIDEAKEELQEIVEFLRDPQKFQRLGGRIPKGVLLVGPPGTGKTLLARAIAGEANVPFFTISGSDFVEMFVGVGASRVRDMFEQGRKNAPCIVFIDEIDAVGRHRGAGLGGGNDEREQTLNQLLVEMDGFDTTEGVILIAATNRPDVLDPALLRPGRFDRQVVVPNPDILGREKILQVHMAKVPLAPDVDPRVIARGTPGFSGADLANLVNEAALLAARKGKRVVTMSEFEEAKDKVMMGAERRSMVMTEAERKLTAYHEAGHALVGLFTPGNDPLHKVTIIPRGRALGLTMNLPERDRHSHTVRECKALLARMFGGRAAEERIFGKENVTNGATSDIQQATGMARRMVTEWGMSEALGPLRYGDNQDEVFLGHSVARQQLVSGATAKLIDEEIRKLIDEAESTAHKVLSEHEKDLHVVADALLEYETLSGEDVDALLRGETIHRGEPEPAAGGPRASVPESGAPARAPEAPPPVPPGLAPQPEG